jgi:hypothetical protein
MSAIANASRRTVLRGMMGGAAVTLGLPLLDCFLNANGTAMAATGAPLPVVFGTWFWGCGLNPGRWEPKTVGANYDMNIETAALQPYKSRINVISGMKVFLDGKGAKPHFTGEMAILTGDVPRETPNYASLDSIVADQIGTKTRFRSLEITGTGKPTDSLSRRSASVLNPAEISPAALYTRVFGPDFRDPNAADFKPDPRIMVRRSVLSGVTDQREALLRQVGSNDRVRLDEYFTAVRQLEQQLDLQLQKPAPLAACSSPAQPADAEIGTEIDNVVANHKLFAQILAHAAACDQTHVFNVVFGEATSPLRRAGSAMTHHILTHEEPMDDKLGYQPQATYFMGRIMESLAFYLQTLDSIKEGDGTLLDRTMLLAHSETGFAKIHALENIPMFIAGGAGGRIKTGLHVEATGEPVTRVGFTIQQALGVPVENWGTQSLNTSKPIREIMI